MDDLQEGLLGDERTVRRLRYPSSFRLAVEHDLSEYMSTYDEEV